MQSDHRKTDEEIAQAIEPPGLADPGQTLLAILALNRKEIEAGELIPAKDVFAELERMDKEAGFI
ncbi:hypothetical protein [Paraburkholderia sp. J63]|uniref:hypothetical protein n=1 Tax=Paraburkholderia sp. J63 TaxID=2805434 RepID=UPI002ABE9F48|nr:hypothetical protein [Paraburkholderia sp. J63]